LNVRFATMQRSGGSCLARQDWPTLFSATVDPVLPLLWRGAGKCPNGNQPAGFSRILGSMRPKPALFIMAVLRLSGA